MKVRKLCPCGSERPRRECCLTSNEVWRGIPRVPLTVPAHGRGLAGCYARSLGGCSSTLSREHYVSDNVLEQFRDLRVSGLVGRPEGHQASVDSLAAKVLCDKHNSDLSDLDSLAGRYYRCLRAFTEPELVHTHGHVDGPVRGYELFDGHALEQWILKVLLGAEAGRVVQRPARQERGWEPDPRLVRILFGLEEFGPGEGLYFAESSEVNGHVGDLEFSPVVSKSDLHVHGLVGNIAGLVIYLALGPVPEGIVETLGRLKRRVLQISFEHTEESRVVGFRWRQPKRNVGVLRVRVRHRPAVERRANVV